MHFFKDLLAVIILIGWSGLFLYILITTFPQAFFVALLTGGVAISFVWALARILRAKEDKRKFLKFDIGDPI